MNCRDVPDDAAPGFVPGCTGAEICSTFGSPPTPESATLTPSDCAACEMNQALMPSMEGWSIVWVWSTLLTLRQRTEHIRPDHEPAARDLRIALLAHRRVHQVRAVAVGVQHVGADVAQQAPDRRVLLERMTGRLVQRNEAHALALHEHVTVPGRHVGHTGFHHLAILRLHLGGQEDYSEDAAGELYVCELGADAYAAVKDNDAAAKALNKALSLRPDYPQAQVALTRLLIGRRDWAQALPLVLEDMNNELPDIGRGIGRGIKNFKEATNKGGSDDNA